MKDYKTSKSFCQLLKRLIVGFNPYEPLIFILYKGSEAAVSIRCQG